MLTENWERYYKSSRHDKKSLNEILEVAFPGETVRSYHLCSGGCINSNFRVDFAGSTEPKLLRLYDRDEQAVFREKMLYDLVHSTVAVPRMERSGIINDISYAVIEFLPGQNLQEVLSINDPQASQAVYEAARQLPAIGKYSFGRGGFFNEQLLVMPFNESHGFYTFCENVLTAPNVETLFGLEFLNNLLGLLQVEASSIPMHTAKLVHGDYSPKNILMYKVSGDWKVSGILDWEFSFSGNPMFDVANFFRHEHELPSFYSCAAEEGFAAGGGDLKENWRRTIKLMDILSMLDIVKRSENARPNAIQHCLKLIHENYEFLVSFS